MQELLGALDGEGRDQEIAAGLKRVLDLALERGAALLDRGVLALAIAVGALAEDVVETGGRVGLQVKDLLVRPEVTGKKHMDGLVRPRTRL